MKKWASDRLIRLSTSHPDWVLGFQDEVWWSRLARPTLHAWAAGEPRRLHEPAAGDAGIEAKALACYGLLRGDIGAMMLRFVQGRPVSQVTEEFLAWAGQRLAKGRASGPRGSTRPRSWPRSRTPARSDRHRMIDRAN